jgi:ABC-type uncharacterized transport system permease subunit
MDILGKLVTVGLGVAMLRMTAPLLLAALGGLFSEAAGMLTINLEGLMLSGAFFGFLGGLIFHGPLWGLLVAAVVGALFGALLALFFVTLRSEQVVVGIIFNLFMLGLTSFTYRFLFGVGGAPIKIAQVPNLPVPGLADIPVVGPILFNNSPLVYLALILVPVVSFVFYRTRWGLHLRFVGENPASADTLGISVVRTRYLSLMICGALAALGGATLTLGQMGMFTDGITAGRGFVALAAIIFGGWKPRGVLAATLVFGLADALQLRIQGLGLPIPYQIPVMMPYILTVLALFIFARNSRSPASLGIPFSRGDE